MNGWVVFDLDGTLLDVSERHYQVYKNIALEFNISPWPFERYWSCRREGFSNLRTLLASGLPEIFQEKARFLWLHQIEKLEFLMLDVLVPFARACLEVASRQFSLVLCTVRSNAQTLKQQLSSLGLLALFRHLIWVPHSDDQALRKALAVRALGLSPLAWVGDSEDDLIAARSLGIEAILVDYGQRSRNFLLKKGASLVVGDLPDVLNRLQRVKSDDPSTSP